MSQCFENHRKSLILNIVSKPNIEVKTGHALLMFFFEKWDNFAYN